MQVKLQTVAKQLLRDKKIEIIIGYSKDSAPVFVTNPKDCDILDFNNHCGINLAVYLHRYKDKKVGIVAKGCDVRSIVELIKEKQIIRENIKIIGVVCDGIIDKYTSQVYQACKECKYKIPLMYDELIGETTIPIEDQAVDEYAQIKEFEEKSPTERFEYFKAQAEKCIRCYACKQVCPLCYCQECFVDSTQPRWLGGSTNLSDNMLYLLIRAYHLAGRCVDCGACYRACPMQVDLRFINKKLQLIVKERFDYIPGLNQEELQPLCTYKLQDKEEFIK
jgi:ferredoxin